MARNNKYTSLNFNDIYEKKIINTASSNNKLYPSSSPSSQKSSLVSPSKTILSNSRIHGHMLVLSRPTPKPITVPSQPPPQPQQNHSSSPLIPDQTVSEPDSISLRPLGRTGSGQAFPSPSPPLASSTLTSPKPDSQSPGLPLRKTDRFVPPHLRPGFVGREEKPGLEFHKQMGNSYREDFGGGHRHGNYVSSPNRYGEDRRPKSGGGYERMTRRGDLDRVEFNRPSSSGARPSSSGARPNSTG